MTKDQYLKVIKSVIESPRNDLQKIIVLQQGFELFVEEYEMPYIHAQWIVPDENYPETCSNCMYEYVRDEEDSYLPKFCPECGAMMSKDVRHLYL